MRKVSWMALLFSVLLLNSCQKKTDEDITAHINCLFDDNKSVPEPELLAPGIIANGFHEHGIAISPEEDEIFWVISDYNYKLYTIVQMQKINDKWTLPEVAPFSGFHVDHSPCFTNDGSAIYFASKRPLSDSVTNDMNIWKVIKSNGIWGEPENVGLSINTSFHEVNPSLAQNGNLYFQSNRHGNWNIYFSEWQNDHFSIPVMLDSVINTENNESRPFIAADESYLLFHSNRPGSLGWMDLYISFKDNGRWKEPVSLGDKINTDASDFGPYVSPDGKKLFFSSYKGYDPEFLKGKSFSELSDLYRSPQNSYATLYWVDAQIIEDLKP